MDSMATAVTIPCLFRKHLHILFRNSKNERNTNVSSGVTKDIITWLGVSNNIKSIWNF
jgi:hypothetical protein